MKTLRLLITVLALCGAAFAWPACNGNWVQVPTGTTGGTIYVTGDHLTFQCQTTPTPTPTPNSSSSATSSSNSNSTSTASSASSASATQKQKQDQNQTQIATGGNAVSDASAANNGNNSNNSVTNVEASKLPVATAYAPSSWPTVTCFKGIGAGVQTGPVGGSFGGGKIDSNCAILEAAGRARTLLAYCKVYVTNKYVKKAGVTLEDCMLTPAPVAPVIVTTPQPLVIVMPPPVLPTPATYVPVVALKTTVKKRRVHHLPPDCQNIVQRVCKSDTKKGQ